MIQPDPDHPNFSRRIDFRPAYSLKAEGFGVHNMEMALALVGPLGAVQIQFDTHWYCAKDRVVAQNMFTRPGTPWFPGHLCRPQATDVGQHRRAREHTHQTAIPECQLLDGATCYYDGTSTWGTEWEEGWIAGGEAWIWPRLHQLYQHWFHEGPIPDLTPEYRQAPPARSQQP